jgi:hypothetical protein
MRIDGRTDVTRVTVAFRKFCEKRLRKATRTAACEVYFKNRKYPLNAHCDLNVQLLDDESDGTDNYHRTKRSW